MKSAYSVFKVCLSEIVIADDFTASFGFPSSMYQYKMAYQRVGQGNVPRTTPCNLLVIEL